VPVAVFTKDDAAVTPFTSSDTGVPASLKPVRVGVVSNVTLSVLDAPSSEDASRSGAAKLGATVSTTMFSGAEGADS
jgi:hypothetical protein